jgi:hypothetical protein
VMGDCSHDLMEREVACADGYCPICLVARIAKLEQVVEAAKEILANGYDQGRRIKLRAAICAEEG